MGGKHYDSEEEKEAYRQEALAWKGSPFLLNGESKEGVGCAGLQSAISKALGRLPPEFRAPRGTGRASDQRAIRRMGEVMESMPDLFERVPVAEIEGDILVFKTKGNRLHHVGGYLRIEGRECVIHSCPNYGVSISSMSDETYIDGVAEVWRILKP